MLAIGLDIGGANLKAATSDGLAVVRPFALWKHPQSLPMELADLLSALPPADALAVTMTGELADCYPSKADGVRSIVTAVAQAAGECPAFYWQTGGEFIDPDDATEWPRLVASANWHALATFCGRVIPTGPGLLIDVGTTTTDLIPLHDGVVTAEGRTDLERLRSGELVYTGATRTPVCALGPTLERNGCREFLAAELFATMNDVYLVLGLASERDDDLDTADGRPATTIHARVRLARMLCADVDEIDESALDSLAATLADRQQMQIRTALNRVLDRIDGCPAVVICGSGSFVAQRIIASTPRLAGSTISPLADLFERRVSSAACAYAVARLAVERGPV